MCICILFVSCSRLGFVFLECISQDNLLPLLSFYNESGIEAKAVAKQTEAAAFASEALHDLKSLAEHAKTLVRLAEDYAAESRRKAAAATASAALASDASSPVDGSSLILSEGISSLVTGLGIVNPVTRAGTSCRCHQCAMMDLHCRY